jgi:hypothetical protein
MKNNDNDKTGKKKKSRTDRGIETLFRTVLTNHMRLSQIADSKANILLSVNAIIISVALSILLPELRKPEKSDLAIPTYILIFISAISMVFAILSTRPKIESKKIDPEDIKMGKVNLLFFGNFARMDRNVFRDGMRHVMEDRDCLYDSLINDLYLMGKVLDYKYRLLGITYHIFMIGIIISVIAFVWKH